jgi:hypothetical protein
VLRDHVLRGADKVTDQVAQAGREYLYVIKLLSLDTKKIFRLGYNRELCAEGSPQVGGAGRLVVLRVIRCRMTRSP